MRNVSISKKGVPLFARPEKAVLMLLSLVTSMVFMLSACAPATPAGPAKVRMALLGILDTLPMYVAQKEGLFEKHGIQAEFIPAGSAAERDQIINAGQADGMINETVSTIFYNKDKPTVQIVRFARTATPESPMYRILAASQSDIRSPEQLKDVEIGISQGTIIEYITDRLLQGQGFNLEDIHNIAVPKINERMALLASGDLKAATLPEPMSTLAEQKGAVLVLDDTQAPDFAYSTYAFRKPFIDENPEAIKGFLAAIEEAVKLINADPQKYAPLLSENKLIPPDLAGTYPVPKFVTASVPSEEQWQDVLDWAKAKGLMDKDLPYNESITDKYLSK